MSGSLSDESRAELEALRASIRRKSLPRGSVTRPEKLTIDDRLSVSDTEPGFSPPTDDEREAERQNIDARDTLFHLKRRS